MRIQECGKYLQHCELALTFLLPPIGKAGDLVEELKMCGKERGVELEKGRVFSGTEHGL